MRAAQRAIGRGFTMIELLMVIAILAIAVSLVTLALPDGEAGRLEEEGARLGALLEMARAEARVSGASVRWVPRRDGTPATDVQGEPLQFRFVGLPGTLKLPTRWLDARVQAEVVGATTVVLGPEAILPAQRIVLSLNERRLTLSSDGLGPFVVAAAASAPP
jgi:general secretion pathway protein H